MPNPHVIVLGAGSAGRRHARNLSALGCRISAFDPRPDRRSALAAEVDLVAATASLREAFELADLDAVAVCSPPSFHADQAIEAINRGLPVLLEKPVSPELAAARRLASESKKASVPVLLGYTWRWWPPLAEARRRLEAGAVGRLLHVRCSLSAHLADWHPWERYQDFFMSSRELGGGALLDESHWIDLMLWMFGMPAGVFAKVDRLSDLEIDADDNVDMLLDYPGGPRVMLHLDLYGRPHERFIQFVGDRGTLRWSDSPNGFRLSTRAEGDWEEVSFEHERNDMFAAVAQEFVGVMERRLAPSCTVDDGIRVLRVIEAARSSQQTGQMVKLQQPTADAP